LFMTCLLAQPAAADDRALLDFMGGQGCTFGPDSRAAAVDAGFAEADVDAAVDKALAGGDARREGTYVVLEAQVCTIRMPEINSPYTVTSPEIAAFTSAVDAFVSEGQPGCFLQDAPAWFDLLKGGEQGAGFFDYADFVAAGLVSGDITLYREAPLETPRGFQIVVGDCAKVPQIEGIRRSHAILKQSFDPIIRSWGASTVCEPFGRFPREIEDMLVRLQGGDPAVYEPQDGVNSWMQLQLFIISAAAGWHEGMTGTEKGVMRPPLCHYPSQS
jgi:hypothetical protein